MANNLESMGVDNISAEDGLTSLASEILNIEPSVSGLNLTTSITLTPEAYNIPKNTSFTLTSILSAEYDDTTVTDVDLSGVLTGANVIFKDSNDNILCTAVTNSNGVAIGTVTNGISQNTTITAYFEGTDNFASCQSSSINIEAHYYELGLKSNNTVIQSGDVETLTATLTDSSEAMENETISFKIYKDEVLVNTVTDTTDSNGVATVSYTGAGVGDVDIVADWDNSLQSNTLTIEDCILWDNATSDNSSNYTKTSNLSISHSTDHYILTSSTNNQMMELGSDYDNVRYEILMSGTSAFARGLYYSDTQNDYETNSLYSIYQSNWSVNGVEMADITGGNWNLIKRTTYTIANDTYYRFIIERRGTSVILIVETEDGTVIETQTVTKSLNSTYIGILMYSGTAYVKNLKIKPLLDLS